MTKEETTKIFKKGVKPIPHIKGIEIKILGGGFMPVIDTEEEKELYLSYFRNKYENTTNPERKIIYNTLYVILSNYS